MDSCWQLGVTLLAGLLAGGPGEVPPAEEVPFVGRPADLPFSEASGQFTVEARAEPTALQAEDPLLLTLRVTSQGGYRLPPQRIDLHQVPEIDANFFLEDPPEALRQPGPGVWEFLYRLKPRRADVREIPGLPFVYFNPDLQPARKGFQVRFTDPIALDVRPREAYAVPLRAPENVFRIGTGDELLARRQPWTPPGAGATALILATPPLLALAWFLSWQRLHPDAARQARQRRSRAARLALHALRQARRLPPRPRADRVAAAVANYLKERLDLPCEEPTPAETALHLGRWGCPDPLVQKVSRFLHTCDAARFRPEARVGENDLVASATELVLAVEEESWARCPA